MNYEFSRVLNGNRVTCTGVVKAEVLTGVVHPGNLEGIKKDLIDDLHDQMYGEIREHLKKFVKERTMCDDARDDLDYIINLTKPQ